MDLLTLPSFLSFSASCAYSLDFLQKSGKRQEARGHKFTKGAPAAAKPPKIQNGISKELLHFFPFLETNRIIDESF
jgi:hypothetical protein